MANNTLDQLKYSSSTCFHLPEPSFHLVSERFSVNRATAIVNIISSPFAVVSNLLIVISINIFSNRHLRTPSNLFIACLALSDVLVGLLVQPGYVTFRLMENQARSVPCFVRVTYSNSFYVCCGVSFMTLTAIAYERLVVVRLRTNCNGTFSSRRVLNYVAAIWAFNVLLTCLQWAGISKIVKGIHLLVWLFCLLLSLITSLRILLILRRYNHRVRSLNIVSENIQRKRTIKQTRTISVIVGVYFLLNFPVLFVTFYHQILEQDIKTYNHYSWAETVAFLNSCTNPLICFWKFRRIRQSVKSTLKKLCCIHTN